MNFDFSWFLTVPGMFITGGVLLLIVALIILIVTSKKSKKAKNIEGTDSTAVAQQSPTVAATPATVMQTDTVQSASPMAAAPGSLMNQPAPIPTQSVSDVSMNMSMAQQPVAASVAPTPVMPAVTQPAPVVEQSVNAVSMADVNQTPVMPVSPMVENMSSDTYAATAMMDYSAPAPAVEPAPVVPNSTVPMVESMPAPVVEPVAPIVEPANLSVEQFVVAPVTPTAPVVPTVPVVENVTPAVEPIAPMVDSTFDVAVPTAPAVEPVQMPVVESVSAIPVAPIVEASVEVMPAAPVVEAMPAPAVVPVAPVVESAIPVVENISIPAEQSNVIPTVSTESQPVIYGGASPIVADLNIKQEPTHQIYGGANPLENTQSIPVVQSVQPVVQPEPTVITPQVQPIPVVSSVQNNQ